nr:M20 family peptidase [uncultured Arsenicibacter sp.]
MKRFFRIAGLALVGLLVVLLVNTFRFTSKQLTDVKPAPVLQVGDSALIRLSQALRIRTVSFTDYSLTDTTQFDQFLSFIHKAYPLIHSTLTQERFPNYAVMYTWPGKDTKRKPVLLIGHYDVVPVIQGTQRMWKHQAFAGESEGGYLYGRGALDDKATVMGLLEAVEYLLKTNYQPEQTIMLAFGPDEETTGRGAKTMAAALKKRGIEPEMVLDEGGVIKTDGVAGLKKQIALVGIAEKGYVSLQLSATGEGGHSSMPPKQTSIGIIASAVAKLETNPFPGRLDAGLNHMFQYIGPEMGFGQRLVFANQWLFSPVISSILGGTPAGDATQRTTTAPTIFKAGEKENVLPIDAVATVNFRILPGETIKSVTERVIEVIGDERVKVALIPGTIGSEPSPVSDPDAAPFGRVQRAIQSVFPEVIVSPYLMLGAADARHYTGICKNVYRFMPVRMSDETLKLLHGTNERIAANDYRQMIQFYIQLITLDKN